MKEETIIRNRAKEVYQKVVAKEFGISPATVSGVVRGAELSPRLKRRVREAKTGQLPLIADYKVTPSWDETPSKYDFIHNGAILKIKEPAWYNTKLAWYCYGVAAGSVMTNLLITWGIF